MDIALVDAAAMAVDSNPEPALGGIRQEEIDELISQARTIHNRARPIITSMATTRAQEQRSASHGNHGT
jgi:hypothetical protein